MSKLNKLRNLMTQNTATSAVREAVTPVDFTKVVPPPVVKPRIAPVPAVPPAPPKASKKPEGGKPVAVKPVVVPEKPVQAPKAPVKVSTATTAVPEKAAPAPVAKAVRKPGAPPEGFHKHASFLCADTIRAMKMFAFDNDVALSKVVQDAIVAFPKYASQHSNEKMVELIKSKPPSEVRKRVGVYLTTEMIKTIKQHAVHFWVSDYEIVQAALDLYLKGKTAE